MKPIQQYISKNSVWFSLLAGLFIIYPNIINFFWDINHNTMRTSHTVYILFFVFRYCFFSFLCWLLVRLNLLKTNNPAFFKRLLKNFKIILTAYLSYVIFSILLKTHEDCFTGYLLFQFLVTFVLFTLLGHAFSLYIEQEKKDKEIEELKFENLKSKCDALTSQIHPHFLFNTLNTLTFLVREDNKTQTLEFVSKLSNIFRYILQSDKNSIVTLREELELASAFRFLMETRFATKLQVNIAIDEDKLDLKIPVLSILPLLENVVMHNIIDSDHKMQIDIFVNERMELVIVNPVYPKTDPPVSNGTGLSNLKSRFALIMNKDIRIENDGSVFKVYLPLK